MASLDKSGYSLKFDWHFFKYGIPNFLGVLLNANQLAKCLDLVDGHEHLSVDISVPYLLDILHLSSMLVPYLKPPFQGGRETGRVILLSVTLFRFWVGFQIIMLFIAVWLYLCFNLYFLCTSGSKTTFCNTNWEWSAWTDETNCKPIFSYVNLTGSRKAYYWRIQWICGFHEGIEV